MVDEIMTPGLRKHSSPVPTDETAFGTGIQLSADKNRYGFAMNPAAMPGIILIFLLVAAGVVWRYGMHWQAGSYRVQQGIYHLEDGRNDRARQEFEQALLEDPSSMPARFGLAVVAMNSGNENQAVALFEKILATDSSIAAAHANLGILYDRAGRHEMALEQYTQALAGDPASGSAPGFLWRFVHNAIEAPTGIEERARYLQNELSKPAAERVLMVPDLDERQPRSWGGE